jgi:hypothetical protein
MNPVLGKAIEAVKRGRANGGLRDFHVEKLVLSRTFGGRLRLHPKGRSTLVIVAPYALATDRTAPLLFKRLLAHRPLRLRLAIEQQADSSKQLSERSWTDDVASTPRQADGPHVTFPLVPTSIPGFPPAAAAPAGQRTPAARRCRARRSLRGPSDRASRPP